MSDFLSFEDAARAVSESATTETELSQIAASYPDLWERVAAHPNASPELLEWLDENGGPPVRATIALRQAPTSSSPERVNPDAGINQTPTDKPVATRHRLWWIALGLAVILVGIGISVVLYVQHHQPTNSVPVATHEPNPIASPIDCDPDAHMYVSITLSTDSTDIDWLVSWLVHTGDFSIHQVLGQLNQNDTGFFIFDPGSSLNGMDADVAAKLAWRPSAADLGDTTDPDWCSSHPGFTTFDPNLTAGVICDSDQQTRYLVGPALLDGTDIRSAHLPTETEMAVLPESIIADLTDRGPTTLTMVSQYVIDQPSPQNCMAIILDGVLYAAPRVMTPLDSGDMNFKKPDSTEHDASVLAAVLDHSQTPIQFELVKLEKKG